MTSIEWTDQTWNPVTGCSKVSPGCAHCYAEELHRTRMDGRHGYPDFKPWTPENAEHNVVLRPDRLEQPLHWKQPRMVFVNSMSDLFHERVPAEFIGEILRVMADCPQHTFQVLTKRPERMRSCLCWLDDAARELPNVWFGTSIENRQFVSRADTLRNTPAAVRFISAEPLLGPMYRRLESPISRAHDLDLTDIDWLIVGGESGPNHRPMQAGWVRDLRDRAIASETAFFFKQWGGRTPKAGGRLLDGREWNEMPAT